MRARVHRHAAGTAHTQSAAAAMLTYSMLRTASAPCAGRTGVFICILEESSGGNLAMGSRPIPILPSPPSGVSDSDGF